MTEKLYTETHKPSHSTFGGKIYLSDFETDYRGKDNRKKSLIAQRIATDWKFDKQCKKNVKEKERRSRT